MISTIEAREITYFNVDQLLAPTFSSMSPLSSGLGYTRRTRVTGLSTSWFEGKTARAQLNS